MPGLTGFLKIVGAWLVILKNLYDSKYNTIQVRTKDGAAFNEIKRSQFKAVQNGIWAYIQRGAVSLDVRTDMLSGAVYALEAPNCKSLLLSITDLINLGFFGDGGLSKTGINRKAERELGKHVCNEYDRIMKLQPPAHLQNVAELLQLDSDYRPVPDEMNKTKQRQTGVAFEINALKDVKAATVEDLSNLIQTLLMLELAKQLYQQNEEEEKMQSNKKKSQEISRQEKDQEQHNQGQAGGSRLRITSEMADILRDGLPNGMFECLEGVMPEVDSTDPRALGYHEAAAVEAIAQAKKVAEQLDPSERCASAAAGEEELEAQQQGRPHRTRAAVAAAAAGASVHKDEQQSRHIKQGAPDAAGTGRRQGRGRNIAAANLHNLSYTADQAAAPAPAPAVTQSRAGKKPATQPVVAPNISPGAVCKAPGPAPAPAALSKRGRKARPAPDAELGSDDDAAPEPPAAPSISLQDPPVPAHRVATATGRASRTTRNTAAPVQPGPRRSQSAAKQRDALADVVNKQKQHTAKQMEVASRMQQQRMQTLEDMAKVPGWHHGKGSGSSGDLDQETDDAEDAEELEGGDDGWNNMPESDDENGAREQGDGANRIAQVNSDGNCAGAAPRSSRIATPKELMKLLWPKDQHLPVAAPKLTMPAPASAAFPGKEPDLATDITADKAAAGVGRRQMRSTAPAAAAGAALAAPPGYNGLEVAVAAAMLHLVDTLQAAQESGSPQGFSEEDMCSFRVAQAAAEKALQTAGVAADIDTATEAARLLLTTARASRPRSDTHNSVHTAQPLPQQPQSSQPMPQHPKLPRPPKAPKAQRSEPQPSSPQLQAQHTTAASTGQEAAELIQNMGTGLRQASTAEQPDSSLMHPFGGHSPEPLQVQVWELQRQMMLMHQQQLILLSNQEPSPAAHQAIQPQDKLARLKELSSKILSAHSDLFLPSLAPTGMDCSMGIVRDDPPPSPVQPVALPAADSARVSETLAMALLRELWQKQQRGEDVADSVAAVCNVMANI